MCSLRAPEGKLTVSKRVAVIGAGPLPIYAGQASMGPGIRTWQLAKPVARHGHTVLLVTFEFAIGPSWNFQDPRYTVDLQSVGSIEHLSLPEPIPGRYEALVESVRERLEAFRPEALVSAGAFFAARVAAGLPTPEPLWIDLYGNTMAEVQAKVARSSQDESAFFRFLYQSQLAILRRGDLFSALSNPQKLAAVGELSLAGRLNDHNLGYDLVKVIPCGYDEEAVGQPAGKGVLRGVHVKKEDFVVLWTGGFNSWVDEQTLFEGLVQAMGEEASLRWVGLGGGISGHFQEGYRSFRRQVEASPLRDRFVFLDWLPTDQVADFYFESDLGINVDLPIYEAVLGGRNRIVGWMAAGLPVLTTQVSEISTVLEEQGIGFTVPVKRPDRLAARLVELCRQRERLPDVGRKARAYAAAHLTFEATTAELLRWVEQPSVAPDREFCRKHGLAHVNSLGQALDDFIRLLEQGSGRMAPSGGWLRRFSRRFGLGKE